MSRKAFTLAEVVVVLMVIAIMTAVAVPRFYDSLSYHRTQCAARRIEADLQLLRRRAKVSGQSCTAQFDPAVHAYSLSGVSDLDRQGGAYTVQLNTAPYQASLVAVDFSGQSSLTFNGFGIPDRPGSVTVQSGAYQQSVLVDAAGKTALP